MQKQERKGRKHVWEQDRGKRMMLEQVMEKKERGLQKQEVPVRWEGRKDV